MPKFNLRALLGRAKQPDTTAAEIEVSHRAAGEEITAAEVAIADAKRAYEAGLLALDDSGVRALAAAQVDAQIRLDRARAAQVALAAQLEAAQARERAAETARLVRVADDLGAEYRARLEKDYPIIVSAMRDLLRVGALAEEANLAADAALQADAGLQAGRLRPGVEAFRNTFDVPRRVLQSREVELWAHDDGRLVGQHLQDRITVQSDGSGTVRPGTHTLRYRFKRRAVVTDYAPAQAGTYLPPLASVVSLPGLMPADAPGWVPLAEPYPGAVVSALSRLEAPVTPAPASEPAAEVEVKPIGEAYPVAHPQTERAARLDAIVDTRAVASLQ